MHIVNNILNWSRWRIHKDDVCTMVELYIRIIAADILVGSGAYDTLNALKRAL
jgi:hypothetical protein